MVYRIHAGHLPGHFAPSETKYAKTFFLPNSDNWPSGGNEERGVADNKTPTFV
jgi:hypothetical protein